ncbi:type III PLP-dependent enzyme [Streptomyces sp. NRRL S-1448]|uniref:type III PLP-dependent enzyme n=1 Tax=Streptomyces sp. NRRL S-1448 TaxID=1463883 RepID=UPI0004C1CE80|nr:type III PLP-dependent enzyme [Streptomyces sp. NRRL S-1448]
MRQQLRQYVAELGTENLPAYVYDLQDLREHAAAVRAALPERVQLFYAAKANSDPRLLDVLRDHVDGFEVASGGELHHIRATCPDSPIAFGGPGKTPAELEQALRAGVDRLHIESEQELHQLTGMLGERTVDVLLRVNLPIALGPVALAMGGRPSPFGLDPGHLDRCLALLADDPRIRLRGIHVHLASGLDAATHLDLAGQVLTWAREWAERHGVELSEVNLGGGMGVDYTRPDLRFDWAACGAGLRRLLEAHPNLTLRIEPGRSVTVYCGWYVTEVLDIKRSHGHPFAVLRGGTHHLRTPATKQHDQPFTVLPDDTWDRRWERPRAENEPVTLVGQLCTPKDVLADGVQVARLRVGDRIAFALAGAYAWNISHHEFLMHPAPQFHHLDHAPVLVGPHP